jgi:hypothetical protein
MSSNLLRGLMVTRARPQKDAARERGQRCLTLGGCEWILAASGRMTHVKVVTSHGDCGNFPVMP